MTIEFHCPHCQKFLRTADDKAGVRANCPHCGDVIEIPFASEPHAEPESQAFEEDDEYEYAEEDVGSASAMKICPACGEQIKAAAVKCRYCGESLGPTRASRGGVKPHRGNNILVLGILGIVPCCMIGLVCSIIAIVMANQDLKEMASGQMDRSGEGLTKTGRVIGIVFLCLQGLLMVLGIGLQLVGIALDN